MSEEIPTIDEALFEGLFHDIGWSAIADAPVNERRVEEIVRRAEMEAVVKETSSFFFLGFGHAMNGMASSLCGRVSFCDEDYRP